MRPYKGVTVMKLVIAASFAALALGTIASVCAQGAPQEVVITGRKAPGSEMQTKTVSYADLDLSKQAGISTLAGRLRSASRDVCAPAPETNDIPGSNDYKKCVSHALNTAVATVNNPGLTTLVAGH
jgi:UrcA family protein